MPLKYQLVRTVIISYISFILTRILGLVFITIAFHLVGKNFLGIWFFLFSFINYFTVIWNSLDHSFVKDFAREYARKDFVQLRRLFNGALLLMSLLGILSVFIILLFSYLALKYFPFSPEYVAFLQVVLLIIAGYVLLMNITIPFQSLITAKQRIASIHLFEAFEALLLTSMGILIILIYPSIKLLAGSYFLVQLLILCSLVFIERAEFIAAIREKIKLPDKATLANMLKYSSTLLLLALASVISFQVDVVIIAYFLPSYYIALYGTCQKIYGLPMDLSLRVATGIIAATSYLSSQELSQSIRELFIITTKYSMVIYFSLGIPIFVYAYPILNIWFGRDFTEWGKWVLQILLIHQWFNINHCVGIYFLKGLGRVKQLLIYSWLCAGSNLVLSLILVQRYGVVGVALGTSIPFIIFELYLLSALLKILEIKWSEYFRRVVLTMYFPPALTLLIYLFIKTTYFNIWQIFLGFALTTLFMTSIYVFSLTKEEKAPFFYVLRKFGILKTSLIGE